MGWYPCKKKRPQVGAVNLVRARNKNCAKLIDTNILCSKACYSIESCSVPENLKIDILIIFILSPSLTIFFINQKNW